MFLMGCELVILIMSNCLFTHSRRCLVTNYLVKTMTSPQINLYHKQYTFTHKWSLLKVASLFIIMISRPPFKNFLNEGWLCPHITHFSCSFTGYVLCEQFHFEFLSEELENNHGSLNITQTDKAAFIL